MPSKPLDPRRSQSSFPTPAANVIAPAEGVSRPAMTSALATVNETLACSSRSGRRKPVCQERTTGEGNAAATADALSGADGSAARAAGLAASSIATTPNVHPQPRSRR